MSHPYIYRESLIRAVTGSDRTDWIKRKLDEEKTARRSFVAASFDYQTASKNIELLEEVLKQSLRNDAARDELHREIEARHAAEQERADAAKLAAIVEPMRTAYLAQPGATAEGFEAALPAMLERRREDAAINATTEREKLLAAARATGKYSI